MNFPLLSLLLCAVLLGGCAAQTTPDPLPIASAESAQAVSDALTMEIPSRNGAVTACCLSQNVSGFLPMNRGLLFFSGTDRTTLTLLDRETGQPLAVHDAGLVLTPDNFTVQRLSGGLSYYDGAGCETVVLDDSLREVRRIPAPQGITGAPLLSADRACLYYCTPDALRVLDPATGISRVLKEAAYPVQGLSGLLLEDSVLQLSITDTDGSWRTLFLSADTGRLLREAQGNLLPQTGKNSYFLSRDSGILLGTVSGAPMLLVPGMPEADGFFLPDTFGCVTAALSGENTVLDRYDLASGSRRASVMLPGIHTIHAIEEAPEGCLWIFATAEDPGTQILYQWDCATSGVSDSTYYLQPYHTREEPDYEGLAACALRAAALGQPYGIEILVYRDAAALEPWDYRLKPEHQVGILNRELDRLEQNLARLPDGVLSRLSETFSSLKICLVQDITPAPGTNGPETVSGVQFLDGYDACIALSCSEDTERALYHELSHLMETVVLTESTGYDRWDNLNPEGFQYGRAPDREWLQPGREWFVDGYAMSAASEDRARLFESAMTAGNEALFRSPPLQSKLRQLCLALREAFDLEAYDGSLLWEQYLWGE